MMKVVFKRHKTIFLNCRSMSHAKPRAVGSKYACLLD
jgi:hypothetical protein